MAKKTLAELVETMQGTSVTNGWNASTWYDQRKTNELLFQLYTERFNTGSGFFSPKVMKIPWGDGSYNEHARGIILSSPRLSFENSKPDQPATARLTMDMISGMLVSTKKNDGGSVYISRILKVLPVGGPKLWMTQPVTKARVTGLGDVEVDISNANQFMADFVFGPLAQEDVGKRFQYYFQTEVKPEDKKFPLGRLDGYSNGVLTPTNFEVRTMKSDPLAVLGDPEYGDGAVILFTTLQGGKDSNSYPNEHSPYLIPADGEGKKYTGAFFLSSEVLFDKVMRGPATDDIGHGISFLDYTPENGGGKDLAWSLKGGSGGIDHEFVHDYKVRSDDFWARFKVRLNPLFKQDAGGAPLTVRAGADGKKVEFVFIKDYMFDFSRVIHWGAGDEWDYGQVHFKCHYRVDFDLILDKESGEVSFDRNTQSSKFEMSMTGYEHLHDLVWEGIDMTSKIDGFFRPILTTILQELSTPTINTFCLRNLLFPGHNALHLSDAFVPGDLAAFGQIDPLRTTTVLSPLNSKIEAGSKLQFTLSRMPENLEYSVKDVDGIVAIPGTIDPKGMYESPPPDELPEGSLTVVVTAKGTLDGQPVQSSALVSVLRSAIVANPLYESCAVGKTLTLSAESLGGDALQWSPLVTQWGSTLTEDPDNPNNRIYTAGTNVDSSTPFPIDTFEIKNAAGAKSYITVKIEQTLITVPMVLSGSSDLPNGKAHFELLGNQGPLNPDLITWSQIYGRGDFNPETGTYTEPKDIIPGEFIILSGRAEVGVSLFGHIAIPIPLKDYQEMIEALDQTIRGA